MADALSDYFDKPTKGLLSKLSTPEAYLNILTLSAIFNIVSLLLHLLFKK